MTVHHFVGIGDAHIRSTDPRNATRLAAFDQIIDAGERLDRLAAWLFPGDVFHQRSTADDRLEVAVRLQRMAALAPVVIAAGNHDLPGELDLFARLAAPWPIHVVTSPRVLSLALATGATAAIFALPYPSRAGLVAVGTPLDQIGAIASQALDAIIIDATAQLETAVRNGALPLMIGHATIGGAVTSVGQPMGLQHDIAIDGAMLARLGPIPKLFSHIHKPQPIHDAYYLGSICPTDFGEVEPKSFTVLELREQWQPGGFDLDLHLINTPQLFHVDAKLTREGFTWRVTAGPGGAAQPPPATWRGCEVRVRYQFMASERTVLSTAGILATFADAKHLQLEPVAVPDRALRAPQVAAARTLTEKVQAWANVSGHIVTPSVLDKLTLLEEYDLASVLTDVAQTIAALEHGAPALAPMTAEPEQVAS